MKCESGAAILCKAPRACPAVIIFAFPSILIRQDLSVTVAQLFFELRASSVEYDRHPHDSFKHAHFSFREDGNSPGDCGKDLACCSVCCALQWPTAQSTLRRAVDVQLKQQIYHSFDCLRMDFSSRNIGRRRLASGVVPSYGTFVTVAGLALVFYLMLRILKNISDRWKRYSSYLCD